MTVATSPEGNAAYLRGYCSKCLVNKHQAGSPMCAQCWPLRTYSMDYGNDGTVVYTMTAADIELAERIGTEWQRVNRTNGVKESRKDGGMTRPEKLSIDGLWAEIAFARVYGLQFNPRTTLIAHAPDYTIHGKTLDIKATDHPSGNLIAPLHKRTYEADAYVLAYLERQSDRVRFMGWETGRKLISASSIRPLISRKNGRPVDTYVVDRNMLRRMDTLERELGLVRA